MLEFQEILPAWVLWGRWLSDPLLGFVVGYACSWIVSAIVLRDFRRAHADSWMEQARLAHPRRVLAGIEFIYIPLLTGAIAYQMAGEFSPGPPWLLGVLTALATGIGNFVVLFRNSDEIRGVRVSPGYRLAGFLTLCLVFYPGLITAAAVAVLLPGTFDLRAWLTLAAGLLVFVLLQWGLGVYLLRMLGIARPSARLSAIVNSAAEEAGLPLPHSYQLRWSAAQAVALPTMQTVLVTDRAMAILDDLGLKAICAHELAHLNESRAQTAARLMMAYALLVVATYGPVAGTFGVAAYVVVVLAWFFAARRFGQFYRRMEVRADVAGASAGEHGIYARALEALTRANMMPAVSGWRNAAYPDLYDRMQAAGVVPDLPRPRPPDYKSAAFALLALVAFLSVGSIAWFWGHERLLDRAGERKALLYALLITPQDRYSDAIVLTRLAGFEPPVQNRVAAPTPKDAPRATNSADSEVPPNF